MKYDTECVYPKELSSKRGPFGAGEGKFLNGWTAEEWATIPPSPPKRGDEKEGYEHIYASSKELQEAVSSICSKLEESSDINNLSTYEQDTFIILIHGYKWEENDCTSEALLLHLGEELKKRFDKLDFDKILRTFPKKPEEDCREADEFYNSLGLPTPVECHHYVGSASWRRWGSTNATGMWSLWNPIVEF